MGIWKRKISQTKRQSAYRHKKELDRAKAAHKCRDFFFSLNHASLKSVISLQERAWSNGMRRKNVCGSSQHELVSVDETDESASAEDIRTSCKPHARLHRDDAPEWSLRPFIIRHYRPQMTVSDALASALVCPPHNETGNILSHLLGLAGFVALSVYHFKLSNSARKGFFAAAYFAGVCAMLLMSSMYHCLLNVSRSLHDTLYVLDLASVSLNIVGISLYAFDVGFACTNTARVTYMVAISAMCAVLLLISLVERLRRKRALIVALFSGVVSATAIPMAHICVLAFAQSRDTAFDGRPAQLPYLAVGLLVMLTMYGIGVALFAARVPEKLKPGAFDLAFHSHQLWHIIVLLAPVPAYVGCQFVGDKSSCSP